MSGIGSQSNNSKIMEDLLRDFPLEADILLRENIPDHHIDFYMESSIHDQIIGKWNLLMSYLGNPKNQGKTLQIIIKGEIEKVILNNYPLIRYSCDHAHDVTMHRFNIFMTNIMEFKDSKDRKIYLDHPLHIKIAQEIILPALTDGINSPIVFDYTT